jgi:hypothetical protein
MVMVMPMQTQTQTPIPRCDDLGRTLLVKTDLADTKYSCIIPLNSAITRGGQPLRHALAIGRYRSNIENS